MAGTCLADALTRRWAGVCAPRAHTAWQSCNPADALVTQVAHAPPVAGHGEEPYPALAALDLCAVVAAAAHYYACYLLYLLHIYRSTQQLTTYTFAGAIRFQQWTSGAKVRLCIRQCAVESHVESVPGQRPSARDWPTPLCTRPQAQNDITTGKVRGSLSRFLLSKSDAPTLSMNTAVLQPSSWKTSARAYSLAPLCQSTYYDHTYTRCRLTYYRLTMIIVTPGALQPLWHRVPASMA